MREDEIWFLNCQIIEVDSKKLISVEKEEKLQWFFFTKMLNEPKSFIFSTKRQNDWHF
jgi:hypothetical protein